MNFNKTTAFAALAILTIAASSCAQTTADDPNYANDLYLSSWVKAKYGDLQPVSEYGYYVLESNGGSGELIGDKEKTPFVYVDYIGSTLDGAIGVSTREAEAKQLGTYSPENYYGPAVWSRGSNYGVTRGINDLLSTMRVGEQKIAAIPGWLLSTIEYKSYKDYRENITGSNSAIYDITVREIIPDIVKWQKDSIVNYMEHNGIEAQEDTILTGFWFQELQECTDTTAFVKETEVYINYVLRRLDGTVIDTNIKDTAKMHHIYDENAAYAPIYVNWPKDGEGEFMNMTMGSSQGSLIKGFKYGIYKMKTGEKARFIFISDHGYEYNGSGDTVPAYSPLRFDVEMIGYML